MQYYVDNEINSVNFPKPTLRRIGHLVRDVHPITGYRAVVDSTTDYTYAIVKSGYKIVEHEKVIEQINTLCAQFPEYGTPSREVWFENHMGRMKTRWTFKEINFEIGKLPDGTPDTVHPTIETFCSYDTSLAQRLLIGGFRVVCTNGMIVGKILSDYKRKHTTSLDIEKARFVLENGMAHYSEVADLWISYKERNATTKEVNCYEAVGFIKKEREAIEQEIKKHGHVLVWDDEDKEKRDVQISKWDVMQILTAEASHKVTDITRRTKILTKISEKF